MRFVGLRVVFVGEYDFVDGGHFFFQAHSRPRAASSFLGSIQAKGACPMGFKSSLLFLASRFDPDWGSLEPEGAANLILQKALVGEVQFASLVGEGNEGWRSDSRLCQVLNSNSITGRGGALEVD